MATVAFDGSTWIEIPVSPSAQLTVVLQLRIGAGWAAGDGYFSGLSRFDSYGETGRFYIDCPPVVGAITDGQTPEAGIETSDAWVAEGDEIALMAVFDTAAGLAGGHAAQIVLNGAPILGATTIPGGTLVLLDWGTFTLIGSWGGSALPCTVRLAWAGYGALDPGSWWSAFFDGSNTPRSLSGAGTIGGVTPFFWQDGNASAWNGGLDRNGNAYTLVGGAVTDVGGGRSDGAASGDTVRATASLVAGRAAGGRSPMAAGQTLAATASLGAGSALGVRSPTVPGATVSATLGLTAGPASGVRNSTTAGQLLAARAGLVPGRASAGTSQRERVLQALFARLAAGKPAGAVILRNAVLPERFPAAGLLILRDGEPGEPALLVPQHSYEHRAVLELVVGGATPGDRSATFAVAVRAVGAALAADRTLGGLVDYATPEAPVTLDLAVAAGVKAATIGILLPYETADPLA